MNQTTLHLAFKAMLYTARKEGFPIEEKYEQLEEAILNDYDYDVTDMVDNIENVYRAIKTKGENKDKLIEQYKIQEQYLLERLRIAEASRKESER